MDYVVSYGTPDQFRASIEIVEIVRDKGPSKFAASVRRVGSTIPLIRATGATAGEASGLAEAMLRHKYGEVEHYQREKHRDLSLGKALK